MEKNPERPKHPIGNLISIPLLLADYGMSLVRHCDITCVACGGPMKAVKGRYLLAIHFTSDCPNHEASHCMICLAEAALRN